MLDDNFANGFLAPPLVVFTTNVPTVGTNTDQIPPIMNVDGTYALFKDCSVDTSALFGDAPFTSPSLPNPVILPLQIATSDVNCDEKAVTISVPSGLVMNSVSFTCYAKYSRTWWSVAENRQVWRFLIQGESHWPFADPSSALGPDPYRDELPPCYKYGFLSEDDEFEPIFKGFIDYALETDDGSYSEPHAFWSVRLSLTHHSGCYSHADFPTLNGHAIAKGTPQRHDDKSYHLVAPATGFQWLGGSRSSYAQRFLSANLLRGEVRSHQDPLHKLLGGVACLTEYGFFWQIHNGISFTCNCAMPAAQMIYYQHDFENIPGTTQANAFAYYWDTSAGIPYVYRTNPVYRVLGLTDGLQFPFFRMELGSWNASEPWNGGVSLFNCGGLFFMQDPYNAGPTAPIPDPDEAAHDDLQLVWGVTTDHHEQGSGDLPSQVIDQTTIYPLLMTDFANQLKHRRAYAPTTGVPLPSIPEVHWGSPKVMSSLIWQLSED